MNFLQSEDAGVALRAFLGVVQVPCGRLRNERLRNGGTTSRRNADMPLVWGWLAFTGVMSGWGKRVPTIVEVRFALSQWLRGLLPLRGLM